MVANQKLEFEVFQILFVQKSFAPFGHYAKHLFPQFPVPQTTRTFPTASSVSCVQVFPLGFSRILFRLTTHCIVANQFQPDASGLESFAADWFYYVRAPRAGLLRG